MTFQKEIYPRTVLLKAAFNFTDRAYIHLDSDDKYYIADIENKDGKFDISEKEFINEMLIQAARYQVSRDTKNIRELIYARAMASTLIEEESADSVEENESVDMTEILKDWFDKENDN